MSNTLVAPSRGMGYTDIYLDFIQGNDPAIDFYLSKSLKSVAEQVDGLAYDREKMAAILARQNEIFGTSEATKKNIEKLKDPRAVCLFSGQQAILFGGPLMVTIKALSILKAAELYSQELDRPVVPIFWIAGDDHDFEEVNHAFVFSRTGELQKIEYKAHPQAALPTSELNFADSEALSETIVQLKDTLGDSDFTGKLYSMIDAAYTSDATFVEAFGKLMMSLLGNFGLVLFNPGDREAKRFASPLFRQIVEKQQEIHDTVTETNQRLQKSGYHIQVEKSDNATHLFYNDGGRKPIHSEGDAFECDGKHMSKDDLLSLIDEHPERFSTDVITRPVIQSYWFPVLSQKGGPAEIAYLAQINPIFSLFGLTAPFYTARPAVTFVEKKIEKVMKQYDISFNDLTNDIEQIINRVMSESFPEDLERDFEALRKDVEKRFEEFSEESLEFDRNLENFAKQTFGKIDYALRNFEDKVFSSHKKKSNTTRDRIYRVGNALYPDRTLQERKVNVLYFLSKYGTDFLQFAYDSIDPEEKSHQLVFLSEMKR